MVRLARQWGRSTTRAGDGLHRESGGRLAPLERWTVYPAMDLRQGKVVRLRQGDPDRETRYADDPLSVARRWQEAGARWLHVVNLDGALDEGGQENQAALERILTTGLRVQFGGGVRDFATFRQVLDLGVGRVVVGTAAVRDLEPTDLAGPFLPALSAAEGPALSATEGSGAERPPRLADLAGPHKLADRAGPQALVDQALQAFGPERVALGLDAREGQVRMHGWREAAPLTALALGKWWAARGVRWVVYTDVARDGMGNGLNLEATVHLYQATGLQVIGSGGVASLEDVQRAYQAGLGGVIIGRALYEGQVALEEALRVGATGRETRHIV